MAAGATRAGTRSTSNDATIKRHPGQVRRIGAKPKTRGTLRALGLGRIGKTNTLPDRPEIRGMIARVPHLVEVDETHAEES